MKSSLKYLPLLACAVLVACSKQSDEKGAVKIEQPKQEQFSSSQSEKKIIESTKEMSSSVGTSDKSRYEKAIEELDYIESLKGQSSENLKNRLNEFLAYLKQQNTLANTDGEKQYLLGIEHLYDFKVDYLGGYEVDSVETYKTRHDDVYQILLTLKNDKGKEAYYDLNYNTILEKFTFFYRDSQIDIDSLPKGE